MRTQSWYRWQVAGGAFVLLALNLYLVRDGFHVIHTDHMNTMHGFWMALARLADVHWFLPAWWPYADEGSPFEYLYAPLVPGLIALWAKLGRIPVSQAFYCVSSLVYLLGPLSLYGLGVGLMRAPGRSLIAGLLYTLTSFTGLLAPDKGFAFHIFDDRRMYLMVLWDDTPHMLALTILPMALLFLARVCTRGNQRRDFLLAVLLSALAALASVFGAVMLGIGVICLLIALGRDGAWRRIRSVALIGVLAYLIVSPFLTPSLLQVIRRDAAANGHGWSVESLSALSLVILAAVVGWHFLTKWSADWRLRFLALFAVVAAGIPAAAEFLNREFLPQAGRYKLELDMAWSLLLPFALMPVWQRLPRNIGAAVLLVLVAFGAEQTVAHRKYCKTVLFPADVTGTIEYRVAKWLAQNRPHERVFLPGSIEKWFDEFSDGEQFSGSSWSTAYNPVQQSAQQFVFASADAEKSREWLEAFGVQAILVNGPQSPEFWKPYAAPRKFDGVLPLLWREQDTSIYAVPQRSSSYAHVMPEAAVRGDLSSYVAALRDESRPLATWHWLGHSLTEVNATTAPGEVVSLQITYAPGWVAEVNGATVPLHGDPRGMMWLAPRQAGPCRIVLRFRGSVEEWLSRVASYGTLLGLLGWALFAKRLQRARYNGAHVTAAVSPVQTVSSSS